MGFMEETRENFKKQGAIICDIKAQLAQKTQSPPKKSQGSFLNDTISDPNEQCHAVTLRSGKTTKEPPPQPSKATVAPPTIWCNLSSFHLWSRRKRRRRFLLLRFLFLSDSKGKQLSSSSPNSWKYSDSSRLTFHLPMHWSRCLSMHSS